MRFPSWIALSFVAAAFGGACDESPVQPSNDLIGYWNLPHRETPSVFGYVSAQVIFREDGTFLFVGTNPVSQSVAPDFTVQGTWSHTTDSVTLDTGDDARTWLLTFEGDEATFTDPQNGETFTLFRPGPD
jgi:hypothetical protein